MDLNRWINENRAKWEGNAEGTEEVCDRRRQRNEDRDSDSEAVRERAKNRVEWDDRYRY